MSLFYIEPVKIREYLLAIWEGGNTMCVGVTLAFMYADILKD